MCHALGVVRSSYYAWRRRGRSKRAEENKQLLEKIKQVYKMSRGSYGSPRISAELRARGIVCGENRIARLMRENGIVARTKRRYKVTTKSRHALPLAENLLYRSSGPRGPNEVWASDITYIRTQKGWLYLTVILDLFNREVVGWAMSDRLNKDLVINALNQAILRRRPPSGLIFHSDRGSQYASLDLHRLLHKHGFYQSMSRKGNCYDNATVESFFRTLKTEVVRFESYLTRAEARQSIFEYIEIFYNSKRRHSALNYRSPSEFVTDAL